ncbi:hypothetical protein SAMN04489841_4376 [Natrinema salaciae]|uniref:Uncharacterized protein n=1 Tax=Natrinema salaciae TaxID=1186196 RepID=A0A1H9RH83_9EURY|nr:hypothetical protein SAMN04489841_4376 [Natrinema salaciae]
MGVRVGNHREWQYPTVDPEPDRHTQSAAFDAKGKCVEWDGYGPFEKNALETLEFRR